jgi:ribose 5-phosphate isomerase B
MKIYIGSDHAGFKLKEAVKKYLSKRKYDFEDLGNLKLDPKDDYPDFGYKVAKKVIDNKGVGVLFCGSNHGVCIVANKVKGVRAVSVCDVRDAKKSREHNDSNVICLSGWDLSVGKAGKIIDAFLKTGFSKSVRHRRRVRKISRVERKEFK